MMQCTETYRLGEQILRCELEAGHDSPTIGGGVLMHFATTDDASAIAWGSLTGDGTGEPLPLLRPVQ